MENVADRLRRQLTDCRSSTATARKEIRETITRAQAARTVLLERIAEKTEDAKRCDRTQSRLREDYEQLRTKLKRVTTDYREDKDHQEQLAARVAELTQQLKTTREKWAAVNVAMTTAQKELEDIKRTTSDIQQIAGEAEQKGTDVEEQPDTSIETLGALEAIIHQFSLDASASRFTEFVNELDAVNHYSRAFRNASWVLTLLDTDDSLQTIIRDSISTKQSKAEAVVTAGVSSYTQHTRVDLASVNRTKKELEEAEAVVNKWNTDVEKLKFLADKSDKYADELQNAETNLAQAKAAAQSAKNTHSDQVSRLEENRLWEAATLKVDHAKKQVSSLKLLLDAWDDVQTQYNTIRSLQKALDDGVVEKRNKLDKQVNDAELALTSIDKNLLENKTEIRQSTLEGEAQVTKKLRVARGSLFIVKQRTMREINRLKMIRLSASTAEFGPDLREELKKQDAAYSACADAIKKCLGHDEWNEILTEILGRSAASKDTNFDVVYERMRALSVRYTSYWTRIRELDHNRKALQFLDYWKKFSTADISNSEGARQAYEDAQWLASKFCNFPFNPTIIVKEKGSLTEDAAEFNENMPDLMQAIAQDAKSFEYQNTWTALWGKVRELEETKNPSDEHQKLLPAVTSYRDELIRTYSAVFTLDAVDLGTITDESMKTEIELAQVKLNKLVTDMEEDLHQSRVRLYLRFKGPKKEFETAYVNKGGNSVTFNKSATKGSTVINGLYHIFSYDDDNAVVFDELKGLMERSLDGKRIVLGVYGHSGAGKSFTMFGMNDPNDPDNPNRKGVMHRTYDWIYNQGGTDVQLNVVTIGADKGMNATGIDRNSTRVRYWVHDSQTSGSAGSAATGAGGSSNTSSSKAGKGAREEVQLRPQVWDREDSTALLTKIPLADPSAPGGKPSVDDILKDLTVQLWADMGGDLPRLSMTMPTGMRPTRFNPNGSSRVHTFLTFFFTVNGAECRITLVDMAGSEDVEVLLKQYNLFDRTNTSNTLSIMDVLRDNDESKTQRKHTLFNTLQNSYLPYGVSATKGSQNEVNKRKHLTLFHTNLQQEKEDFLKTSIGKSLLRASTQTKGMKQKESLKFAETHIFPTFTDWEAEYKDAQGETITWKEKFPYLSLWYNPRTSLDDVDLIVVPKKTHNTYSQMVNQAKCAKALRELIDAEGENFSNMSTITEFSIKEKSRTLSQVCINKHLRWSTTKKKGEWTVTVKWVPEFINKETVVYDLAKKLHQQIPSFKNNIAEFSKAVVTLSNDSKKPDMIGISMKPMDGVPDELMTASNSFKPPNYDDLIKLLVKEGLWINESLNQFIDWIVEGSVTPAPSGPAGDVVTPYTRLPGDVGEFQFETVLNLLTGNKKTDKLSRPKVALILNVHTWLREARKLKPALEFASKINASINDNPVNTTAGGYFIGKDAAGKPDAPPVRGGVARKDGRVWIAKVMAGAYQWVQVP